MVHMVKLLSCVASFLFCEVEPTQTSGVTTCMEGNYSQSVGNVDCNSPLTKSVCLVCNVRQSFGNLSWYYGKPGMQLARNDHSLHSKHAGGMIVNGCNSQNYSLKLMQPSVSHTLYYCKANDKIVLRFHLAVQAVPTLFINSSGMMHGVTLFTYVGSSETLMCSVEGAFAPVRITWLLNNVLSQNQTFTGKLDGVIASFTFPIFEDLNEVTCSCEGPYVVDTHTKVVVHKLNGSGCKLPFWDNIRGAAVIVVPLLILVVLLICLVLYFKCQIHRDYSISKRNETVSANYESSIRECNVNMDYTTSNTQDLEIDIGVGNSHKSFNMSLVTRLRKGAVFEYWSATYHLGSSNKGPCLVKRMGERSTDEATHLCEEVAKNLNCLIDNIYVVNILHINLEKIPYYVCYEFMAYGTLRDLVWTKFEKAPEAVAANNNATLPPVTAELLKQTKELVRLATQVVEGMVFVTSQKFSHPILSMRKVLITEHCNCKLYDIYPHDTALMKIKSHMRKDVPSFAWMSPETMFSQKYLPTSDVWSYSVLLWELFSLGETPFATLEPSKIPQHIRGGGLLSKPRDCPDLVYGIMQSSWNHNPRKRPSFQQLQQKLQSILSVIDQETYDGRFYDSLIH